MNEKSLTIIAKVRDAATRPLKEVQRAIRDTGSAAKASKQAFDDTSLSITKMYKSFFTAASLAAMLKRGFHSLGQGIIEGAELDRVEDQFERVLGKRSTLINSIRSFTGTTVDQVEAMRSAIALKTIGIGNNMTDIGELIAGAAQGAKEAAVDVNESIKKVTQSFKDGSLSSLEYFNAIRTNDPVLKTMLHMLNKYAKDAGPAVTAMEKQALLYGILRRLAHGAANSQRDLLDVVADFGQALKISGKEAWGFVGTALIPLIDKVTTLFYKWSETLREIRKDENSRGLLLLTKYVIGLTASVLTLATALATLSLAIRILKYAGLGIGRVLTIVAGATIVFAGITDKVDGLQKKLNLFGNFLEGVYQLVSSFNKDTGLSEIDTDIKNMLKDAGIYDFTVALSKGIVVVKEFGKAILNDIGNAFKWVYDKVGLVADKLFTFLGKDTKPWSKDLITFTYDFNSGLLRILKTVGTIIAAFYTFKSIKGLLSKIPIVGKVFSSSSGTPKGNKHDPIYTRSADGVLGTLGSAAGDTTGIATIAALLGPWDKIKNVLYAIKEKIVAQGAIASAARGISSAEVVGVAATARFGLAGVVGAISAFLAIPFVGIVAAIASTVLAFYSLKDAANNATGWVQSLAQAIINFFGVKTEKQEKDIKTRGYTEEQFSQYWRAQVGLVRGPGMEALKKLGKEGKLIDVEVDPASLDRMVKQIDDLLKTHRQIIIDPVFGKPIGVEGSYTMPPDIAAKIAVKAERDKQYDEMASKETIAMKFGRSLVGPGQEMTTPLELSQVPQTQDEREFLIRGVIGSAKKESADAMEIAIKKARAEDSEAGKELSPKELQNIITAGIKASQKPKTDPSVGQTKRVC